MFDIFKSLFYLGQIKEILNYLEMPDILIQMWASKEQMDEVEFEEEKL